MKTAMHKQENGCDPTPMRAYSRHDLLIPPEMSFGDYGDFSDGEVVGLTSALKRFAKNLKIQANQYQQIIEACLRLTSNYGQKINELTHLPDLNKENLSKIHRRIYVDLQKIVD